MIVASAEKTSISLPRRVGRWQVRLEQQLKVDTMKPGSSDLSALSSSDSWRFVPVSVALQVPMAATAPGVTTKVVVESRKEGGAGAFPEVVLFIYFLITKGKKHPGADISKDFPLSLTVWMGHLAGPSYGGGRENPAKVDRLASTDPDQSLSCGQALTALNKTKVGTVKGGEGTVSITPLAGAQVS